MNIEIANARDIWVCHECRQSVDRLILIQQANDEIESCKQCTEKLIKELQEKVGEM